MKVLAPISAYDELEMLAASGAEEFYCGIVPREWLGVSLIGIGVIVLLVMFVYVVRQMFSQKGE